MHESHSVAKGATFSPPGRLAASELLRRKIRLVNPHDLSNSPSVLIHPRLREFFPDLLFILYSTIRATSPLLEAAIATSRARAVFDPVAEELAPYLEKHAAEEEHHDEWLLEDMEALGMNRAEVLKRLPPPDLAAAVGCQYYWIHHYHPVALLGYMAVLEGDPTPAGTVEKAVAQQGLPRAAFRSLFIHAEHDFSHRDDLNQMIDQLPLEAHHFKVISISAMQIASAYEEAFLTILPG
jgi:Iron-containing redox enzyme